MSNEIAGTTFSAEATGGSVDNVRLIEGGDIDMLGFETLTFCPIDRRLVVASLLTDEELNWLNAYHAETREKIAPLLSDDATRSWLEKATAPISR